MNGATDIDHAMWALRAYDTGAVATVSAEGPQVAGVYFAPEATATGIRLIIATLHGSRTERDIAGDPRVAFLCSPGNASRWIQGTGVAATVDDAALHSDLLARLVAHAPGARPFVESPSVLPMIVTVHRLKIVESAERPPLLFAFEVPGQ